MSGRRTRRVVDRLLGARSWRRKRRLLRRHARLTGAGARRRLSRLAARAVDERRDPYVYLLHLALVRRARAVGPRRAVTEVRAAVERIPDLVDGGVAAMRAYRDGDGTRWLSTAVDAFARAESLAVAGLPDRSAVLANLGLALLDRFDALGDPADLHRSSAVLEEAGRIATDGDQRRAAWINHGSTLVTIVEEALDTAALDRAEDLLEAALALPGGDDAQRAIGLNAVGRAKVQRYRITTDPAALDEAVTAFERAAARPGPGGDRARALTNLGVALSERHLAVGNATDLERALAALTDAVAVTPPRSPELPARRAALGSVLAERFTRHGDPGDLDRAIEMMDAALRGTPAASRDHPDWLMNLALVLRDRYLRDGDLTDLTRVLELLDAGLAAAAPPGRPEWLDQLAVTLRMSARQRGDAADLRRAVELHRAAADATSASAAVLRPVLLNNLGGSLRAWWSATGDAAALDEALDAYRRALDALPAASPERAGILSNLGAGLLSRFQATSDRRSLDEAVRLARSAVQATAAGSADRPARLYNLATALRHRHDIDHDERDGRRAEAAYRAAVEEAARTATEVGLRAGIGLGAWASEHGRWPTATAGYGSAVDAAERLLRRQLTSRDTEAWLHAVRDVPAAAALAHCRLGQADDAVVRLEWGRARLLADALGRSRADLTALERGRPELVARYRAAAARVRALTSERTDGSPSITSAVRLTATKPPDGSR